LHQGGQLLAEDRMTASRFTPQAATPMGRLLIDPVGTVGQRSTAAALRGGVLVLVAEADPHRDAPKPLARPPAIGDPVVSQANVDCDGAIR
jgi:hypothetical protein